MNGWTRRQVVWVALVLAVCLVATVALTAAVFGALKASEIRSAQQGDTKTLENTQRTLDVIEDCTQPGGECYRRGQERTAEAVGNINRVIVLAAACAVGVDPTLSVAERQALIQACVIDRLSAEP